MMPSHTAGEAPGAVKLLLESLWPIQMPFLGRWPAMIPMNSLATISGRTCHSYPATECGPRPPLMLRGSKLRSTQTRLNPVTAVVCRGFSNPGAKLGTTVVPA